MAACRSRFAKPGRPSNSAAWRWDFLRWWDDRQSADVLHFFGRMPPYLLLLAHQRGMKVVITELLGGQGARPAWRLNLQRRVMRGLERAAPARLAASLSWRAYRQADACVALTPWEKQLFERLYAVPPARVSVIPNGVEEVFLQSAPAPRDEWLVSVATITEIKRTLELAEAAIAAPDPHLVYWPSFLLGRSVLPPIPAARPGQLALCPLRRAHRRSHPLGSGLPPGSRLRPAQSIREFKSLGAGSRRRWMCAPPERPALVSNYLWPPGHLLPFHRLHPPHLRPPETLPRTRPQPARSNPAALVARRRRSPVGFVSVPLVSLTLGACCDRIRFS